tara:strand:+ start:1723 stop:2571 length:849 start_codon:yes stop_codon:yes gene_type:complete
MIASMGSNINENPKENQTQEMAKKCRSHILKMTSKANSGHPGGSLSAIDILVCLYATRLRVDPKNPEWEDRDRFVMSKGHASPGMYAALREMDFITDEDMDNFRQMGGICQGHVDSKWTPGVDFSAGSLGMGLSFGIGCALAGKMEKSNRTVFVLIGDGEIQEGQVWEAAMSASNFNLGNLKVFLDNNGIQNDDFCDNQMLMGDISKKWEAFGWEVKKIDGHCHSEIMDSISWLDSVKDKPAIVIAKTVKGKGVSFMENNPAFHGAAANKEQLKQALEEING